MSANTGAKSAAYIVIIVVSFVLIAADLAFVGYRVWAWGQQPPPRQQRTETAEEEVKSFLRLYGATQSNLDIDGHMDCYAETVNWFGETRQKNEVRNDVVTALGRTREAEMFFRNLEISVAGERATVYADKYWRYLRDDRRDFCGYVRDRLELQKQNGRWLMVAIQDVKDAGHPYGIYKGDCAGFSPPD